MLGLGVAVLGYVGKEQRIQWPLLLGGVLLVYAARPELAAVLLASMLVGQVFSLTGRWTLSKVLQTAVFAIAALYGLQYATAYMGIESWDAEGVQSYIETDPSRRATGKTNVTAVGISILQTPIAVGNVLLRPFIWEARNIMVLLSSLEVLGFLIIVLIRRRNLARALRSWRSDRLLRLAVIFSVLYPAGLGMMVVNMGIIARQRVLLFPFLFILLEAQPRAARIIASRRRSHRVAGTTYSPPVEQVSKTSSSLPAPGTSLSRTSIAVDSHAMTND